MIPKVMGKTPKFNISDKIFRKIIKIFKKHFIKDIERTQKIL